MISTTQFSVVLPLYNKVESIERTIATVLDQSHSAFELIVVNDGSTDGSEQCVHLLDDPRISVVSQKNQGVSVARNTGINAATHNLIAFIDGDDLWHPDYLATIAKMHELHPDAHCYSTYWVSWTKDQPISKEPVKFDPGQVRELDYVAESINEVIVHIGSIVVKKNSAQAVGGFPPGVKFLEDQDFCCRLAELGPFWNYSKALLHYVKDAENRACLIRSVVNDMPPYYKKCEPVMLTQPVTGSSPWHLKEYLITRYLSEFSVAAQTPGHRQKALRWWWLCRKTKKSRMRFMKGAAYLMLPATLLQRLIARIPGNLNLKAE